MKIDRVLIRTILGILAALTLVIVASALHRMDVYADTYGLTRLRVLDWPPHEFIPGCVAHYRD